MANKNKSSKIKKSKSSEHKKHISKDWLSGYVNHSEAIKPVSLARWQLEGYSEKELRKVWEFIYDIFKLWRERHGEVPLNIQSELGILGRAPDHTPKNLEDFEPWFCADSSICDPVDLLNKLKNENITEFSLLTKRVHIANIYAIIILHEIAIGDDDFYDSRIKSLYNQVLHMNGHIVTAIKANFELTLIRFMEVLNYATSQAERENILNEIRREGQKLGALANKAKAEQRRQGIRDAADYHFKNNPGSNYEDCITWIIEDTKLNHFTSINNKKYSRSRIKKIITGVKKQALKPPSK